MKIAVKGKRCPAYVCQMFQDSIERSRSGQWLQCRDEELGEHLYSEEQVEAWKAASPTERALWLTGKLWNDTRTMPRGLCDALDLQPGSTYAQGARKQRSLYRRG